MVIKSKIIEGFFQKISESQMKVLIDSIKDLCDSSEHVFFLSNLPKDLEEKAFKGYENYEHFSDWQYGEIKISYKEDLNLIKNLWSLSYGTLLCFLISPHGMNSDKKKMLKTISKLKWHNCGIITFLIYGEDSEIPILLKTFNKILAQGHDGETLDIYWLEK